MTVTQLGEALGVAPARVHYHVRELERVGLLHLAETREKGGILEKYYRPVARTLDIRRSLLQSLSPDEHVAAVSEIFQSISQGFAGALARAADRAPDNRKQIVLARSHLWLTNEEFDRIQKEIQAILEPYEAPRGLEGETERSFIEIVYDALDASEEEPSSTQPALATASVVSPTTGRRSRTLAAGALLLTRADFEQAVARGETMDINLVGFVSIADDVPADLVDRALTSFRHKGVLRASPEVRAVLERKEVPADA
jgi:DNA-binding transcriptional ArsR family regulator